MSRFAGKTVLITGATGLIGSHIVDKFMSMKDVNVIALGRSAGKIENGFAEYLSSNMFNYIEQDISKPLNIPNVTIDYIFHAAGPMENKIIVNTPLDVINPNIYGTQNCLEYLRKQEIEKKVKGRIVIFSSVTIYGNISNDDIVVNEVDTAVTEKLDTTGEPYSQSKRISEVIARAYHRQYGTDIIIARFATVYGDTRFLPDTAFFEFIRKATSGKDIVINSSGAKRRDNIYIDDVISALICLIEKGKSGEAYNISSNGELGNFAAIDEIAKVVVEIANKKVNVNRAKKSELYYKTAMSANREPGVILDNDKIKALGWSLDTDLETGVQLTIESYLRKQS